MTTEDAVTIQDGSADVVAAAERKLTCWSLRIAPGTVAALRTNSVGLNPDMAQDLLRRSVEQGESRDWWLGGGHLYEVWIQPIYFGAASQNTTIGLLAVGHEIDDRAAKDFGNIASSEVAFNFGDSPVASTLNAAQRVELARSSLPKDPKSLSRGAQVIGYAGNSAWIRAVSRRNREPVSGWRPVGFVDRPEIVRPGDIIPQWIESRFDWSWRAERFGRQRTRFLDFAYVHQAFGRPRSRSQSIGTGRFQLPARK